MAVNKIDSRQTKLVAAQAMLGSAANDTLDTVFPKINDEIAKLFEDRNALLVDGGVITVDSTATSVSFSASLKLHINSKVAGGAPVIIDLTATTRAFTIDGNMLYAVVNRTGGTAVITADSATLPAQDSTNQEVFLIAKRVGTVIYFRNNVAIPAGRFTKFTGQSSEFIQPAVANDAATTGNNATLAAVASGLVRLTNVSLASVSGIPAGLSGQQLTIENQTGSTIFINNQEVGASVPNRIFTGTGANVSMPANSTFSFVYDATAASWMMSGAASSGSVSFGDGFQAFVDQSKLLTPTTGAPGAGQFWSTITNRKPIVDLTQDLKPRMGIERIQLVNIFKLPGEFGPNGEVVWATSNDKFSQIRFVGGWSFQNSTNGALGIGDNTGNSYLEITFWGTGLNIVNFYDNSTYDYRATIDNGAEGANFMPSSGSNVLSGLSYAKNNIFSVANGLTPGTHTVKIRCANTSLAALLIFGFEVLNESSSVKINPGIVYNSGTSVSTIAQASHAYNSVVTGTKGGRVVEYQAANGTIGQAFRAVDATQLTLGSTDHTNEEVARVYNFREFGANRTDDFSSDKNGNITASFTLEDGSTSLSLGGGTNQAIGRSAGDAIGIDGAGSLMTISFVGCGLDISRSDISGTTGTNNVYVDGTLIGSLSTTQTPSKIDKIVSGLPYGEHVVTITTTAGGSIYLSVVDFIVYQPKKPTIPTGAVELGNYNVMADYVANTVAAVDTIGAGVLRKTSARELVYVEGSTGTANWTIYPIVGTFVNGTELATDRLNATAEYTFFGTGFDLRFLASPNRSTNITVSLQRLDTGGSLLLATTTNFPSLVSSVYGASVTFAAGILNQNSASSPAGAGLSLSALPLGTYRVVFQNNVASAYMGIDSIDIITPIHSPKSNLYANTGNALPIGSCAIEDARQITPVKELTDDKKSWVQVSGVTNNPTTSSTLFVPVPEMSATIKTSGGRLKMSAQLVLMRGAVAIDIYLAFFVDSRIVYVPSNVIMQLDHPFAGYPTPVSVFFTVDVAPGVHKVDLMWAISAGGVATAVGAQRNLLVEEV